MPAYEHLDDAGEVVERSVTFEGTPLDAQMRAAASDPASAWYVAQTADTPRHKIIEPTAPTPTLVAEHGPELDLPAPPAIPAQSTPDTASATEAEQPPADPQEA